MHFTFLFSMREHLYMYIIKLSSQLNIVTQLCFVFQLKRFSFNLISKGFNICTSQQKLFFKQILKKIAIKLIDSRFKHI